MTTRIRNYRRLLMALALAPVLATFVLPAGNCLLVLFGDGVNCLAGVTGYAWYGLPPAVLGTVFLGVPLLFLFLRGGWVKAWQFFLSGAGVGACASMLFGLADHHLITVGLLMIAIPTGAVTAGVVWLVGVYGNLEPDGTHA